METLIFLEDNSVSNSTNWENSSQNWIEKTDNNMNGLKIDFKIFIIEFPRKVPEIIF